MPVYRERRTAPAPLTDREQAIVDHRQEQIVRACRAAMTDDSFKLLAEPESISTKGGLAYQRQIMFAKVAIDDEGRNLLRFWPAIKSELQIPWGVHYYNMSLAAWKEIGARLESGFYSSMTGDFDEAQLLLYKGRWLPIEEVSIPGFALVELDDALEFLGHIGGVDPREAHPGRLFTVRNISHVVIAGSEVEPIQIVADVYAEFPVTYVGAASPAAWWSLDDDGLLTLEPPAGTAGEFTQDVTATDGLGAEVAFTLTVTVLI